jgi:hypothetical protein
VRFLDRYGIEPAAVTDNRRDLPLTVGARPELIFVLLFPRIIDVDYLHPNQSFPQPRPEGGHQRLRAFSRWVLRIADDHAATLAIRLKPGGRRTSPVRRLPGMTPRFESPTSLQSQNERLTAISIVASLGQVGKLICSTSTSGARLAVPFTRACGGR